MANIVPRCVSLIVCRQVSVDPDTGCPTIENIQQSLALIGPVRAWTRLVVWAELEDGLGAYPVHMKLLWSGARNPARLQLAHMTLPAVFTRPGQLRTMLFVINDVPCPGAGTVEFRVACEGSVIMRRSLPVVARDVGFNWRRSACPGARGPTALRSSSPATTGSCRNPQVGRAG